MRKVFIFKWVTMVLFVVPLHRQVVEAEIVDGPVEVLATLVIRVVRAEVLVTIISNIQVD